MTEAEELLRGALHRVADGVGAEPVPQAVVRRAHRRRRRRRVGFAAAGAALVTAAVPFGASLVGVPQPTQGVATDHPVAGSSTAAAKEVAPVSIDFAKLPRGAAPSVAYYADGVIHDGDKAIPFRGYESVAELAKVADGYAVVADRTVEGGPRALVLVRPDGSRRVIGSGMIFHRPAVSASGRLMAWSSYGATPEDSVTTLYLTDTATGAPVQKLSLGSGEDNLAQPRAIIGSKIIVERATNAATKPVLVWDPDTNELTDWYDGYGVAGTSADGSKVAVSQASSYDEEVCFDLVTVADKRWQWRSCDYDHWGVAFAPDGNHLLAARARFSLMRSDDGAPSAPTSDPGGMETQSPRPDQNLTAETDLFALNAATGRRVLQIKDQQPLQRTWESADTFLFTATDGKQDAIVRCSLAGRCELATPPGRSGDVVLDARTG